MPSNDEQAARSLRELGALTDQTRRVSRSMVTGLPMLGWGTAWILGLSALDLLQGPARILVAAGAWVLGVLLSWLPLRAAIRTGSERRIRSAWVIVLIASPFLVTAAGPASFVHGVLLLGALWGLAMCLHAVATHDPVYGVAAGIGVVAGGVLAVPDIPHPLVWFGLSAGLPLLVLGIHRVRGAVDRV